MFHMNAATKHILEISKTVFSTTKINKKIRLFWKKQNKNMLAIFMLKKHYIFYIQ